MNKIEKAFEAGFREYRDAFDPYDDSDGAVEYRFNANRRVWLRLNDVNPLYVGVSVLSSVSGGVY